MRRRLYGTLRTLAVPRSPRAVRTKTRYFPGADGAVIWSASGFPGASDHGIAWIELGHAFGFTCPGPVP